MQQKLIAIFTIIISLYAKSLLAQTTDTIIDSNENWQVISNQLITYYKTKPQAIEIIKNQLTVITVTYYGFDNAIHKGQIICNKKVATDFQTIFNQLFQLHFFIQQVKPISNFNYNDVASMQANNTNCFDYRLQTNSKKRLSKHALGLAIDINPIQNPYIKGSQIFPANANTNSTKGLINLKNDLGKKVITLFKKMGFKWGGNFKRNKDYMHFEK